MDIKHIDCKNIRKYRQVENNKIVYDLIKDGCSLKELEKKCNKNELKRVLDELDINSDSLFDICRNDVLFLKLLSMHISINSSRQGTKDENFLLSNFSQFTEKLDIHTKVLGVNDFRATKDGKIISKKKYDLLNINTQDCLKSFDAKITSKKINGWIFCKITYSNGGHQDNVIQEACEFCEWVIKYGQKNDIYIVLIETDRIKQVNLLKTKYYKNNILIVNYIELQSYFLAHFS